jgi:RNA-splicing ligase RtcB
MPEHPDPSAQRPPGRPGIGETLRAKLEEYDVERHLSDVAETVEHVVRQGVSRAGEFTHQHKGDIDRLLDKAATAVDRRTEGRHADKINQLRGSLERGVEKIAEQRPGDVPPSNG